MTLADEAVARETYAAVAAATAAWVRVGAAISAPEAQKQIAAVGDVIVAALRDGKKILVAGNGGSAAMAGHIAAEFAGKCVRDRRPLPAVSLADSSASITAVGNDYGFDDVFARGVAGLGQSGDIFIAMSTSGRSPNILRAIEAARERGLTTVLLTGAMPAEDEPAADFHLMVPSESTPRVQEVHLMWAHSWCEAVDHLWARG